MRKECRFAFSIAVVLLIGAAGSAQAGALDAPTEEALRRALDDERHAQAVYQTVIDRHGEVRPFANIIHAERRHESYLLALFEEYGAEVPNDPWPERALEAPATLGEACAQAVEAEKANVALYDELLALVAEPEIRDVFERLRASSQERHRPAFERCSAANRGRGRGPGRRHDGTG